LTSIDNTAAFINKINNDDFVALLNTMREEILKPEWANVKQVPFLLAHIDFLLNGTTQKQ
jgi:hypothetical protein